MKFGILVLLLTVSFGDGSASARAADPAPRQTQNVILITYDGLRWQEVFGG